MYPSFGTTITWEVLTCAEFSMQTGLCDGGEQAADDVCKLGRLVHPHGQDGLSGQYILLMNKGKA